MITMMIMMMIDDVDDDDDDFDLHNNESLSADIGDETDIDFSDNMEAIFAKQEVAECLRNNIQLLESIHFGGWGM